MSTPPPWDPRVWCLIDGYVGFEVTGILHGNNDTKIYASLYSVYVTGLDPDAFDGRDHRERLTRAEKWLYTTLRPCGFISSWQAFTFPKVTNLNISLTFDSEDAARRALAMDGKRRQWDGSRIREMTIKVAVRTCRKKSTMALIKRADWPTFISRRLGDPHALDDARALNQWYPYSRETDFTLPMVPRSRNTTRFEDVGIPASFQPHTSYDYIVPVPSRGSWSPRNPSSPSGSVLEVTGEESKPSTAVVVANGGGGGDKPPGSSKGGKGYNHTGSSLTAGRWPRDKHNSQNGNRRPHPYQGKNHEKKVRYKANKAAKEEAARRALEDKVRAKAKTLGRRLEAGKAAQQQKVKKEKVVTVGDAAAAVGEPGEIIVTVTTGADGLNGTSNCTTNGQTHGHHTSANGQANGHTHGHTNGYHKKTANGGAPATTITPPDADDGAFYGPPRPDHPLMPSITASSSPAKKPSQHHHKRDLSRHSRTSSDDFTDELAQIRAEVDALLEVATKNLEAQEQKMEQQSRASSGRGRQSDEGVASVCAPNGVNRDDGIMVVDDDEHYDGGFFLDLPEGPAGYDDGDEYSSIGAVGEKMFHSGRSSPPYSPEELQFY